MNGLMEDDSHVISNLINPDNQNRNNHKICRLLICDGALRIYELLLSCIIPYVVHEKNMHGQNPHNIKHH